MGRTSFTAPVAGGQLAGWREGHGAPVLLLHGGPGLSYDYLDDIATEIGEGYEIAAFQQRGIAPSMIDGPYDVATHLADVAAVLDALEWQMAYVVGHSWGGHLGFHVAATMPERLLGVLCLDPLGAVGDGGAAVFSSEMLARCPEDVRAKVAALDAAALRGHGTRADGAETDGAETDGAETDGAETDGAEADGVESMRLYWPAYFADWKSAPPMPEMVMSVASYAGGFASLNAELPALEAALPSIAVPVGIVAGKESPMPPKAAAVVTAEAIPGAWVDVVPAAGHFPWFEQPGCVRAALDRLAGA